MSKDSEKCYLEFSQSLPTSLQDLFDRSVTGLEESESNQVHQLLNEFGDVFTNTIEALSGVNWFSTLDLKSGYWQVPLDESSKEKTAFSTGSGLWQFTVMPFGLCNAPATFERLMEQVLFGLPMSVALVYLDDILVPGNSFENQLLNLRLVFERLRKAKLKLSPKKCSLFRREVHYLGHLVNKNGVRRLREHSRSAHQCTYFGLSKSCSQLHSRHGCQCNWHGCCPVTSQSVWRT